MYNLLTNKNIFSGRDYNGLMQANIECKTTHVDAHLRMYSVEVRDLIRGLL